MIDARNAAWAYLILRFGTGVNLFMHGWVRVGDSFEKFHGWIVPLFASTGLPSFMVEIMAYAIPAFELIFGLALIFGFFTRVALIGAGLLITSLIFGMSLLQNWEIVGLQMTYLVIYFLLLLFLNANRFSIDGMKGVNHEKN